MKIQRKLNITYYSFTYTRWVCNNKIFLLKKLPLSLSLSHFPYTTFSSCVYLLWYMRNMNLLNLPHTIIQNFPHSNAKYTHIPSPGKARGQYSFYVPQTNVRKMHSLCIRWNFLRTSSGFSRLTNAQCRTIMCVLRNGIAIFGERQNVHFLLQHRIFVDGKFCLIQ